MSHDPIVKQALISVADKTGIVDFARALVDEFGVRVISTGGTAACLADAGVSVTALEDVVDYPEILGGRVKTLHPGIHGGLLAKRDDALHMAQAAELGIEMIDMVVVNLSPFEAKADAHAECATCIENIDIGGSSLLRSAAKNYDSVVAVTDCGVYGDLLAEMRANGGATTLATRRALALEAFRVTGAYDTAIAEWLSAQSGAGCFPDKMNIQIAKREGLRYGENPRQAAALYLRSKTSGHSVAEAEQLGGRPLSFNNMLDVDACWAIVRAFEAPAVVITKHQSPCGTAEGPTIADAFERALACDPKSAYGGVVGANRVVTADMAARIDAAKLFMEVIIAPGFEPEALELLKEKPNVRVLSTGGVDAAGADLEYRTIDGGVLVQEPDSAPEDRGSFTVPTKRQPTSAEMDDLMFAWTVAKGARSNAVVIASGRRGIGLGAGQPNRVDSCELACERAGDACRGAVAASDAFFPFRDGIDTLARHGVTAVIQPGGSIRDEECIAACDEAGMAMVFTGRRHFRH